MFPHPCLIAFIVANIFCIFCSSTSFKAPSFLFFIKSIIGFLTDRDKSPHAKLLNSTLAPVALALIASISLAVKSGLSFLISLTA